MSFRRGRRLYPRNGLRDLNLTQTNDQINTQFRQPPKRKLFDRSPGRDAAAITIDWPSDTLPVEIFELITSHLTRQEIKCLRLVCREFEIKVSAHYFRNVVVPFKTELYSTLARDDNGALTRASSALFSNGMRIFESFGCHILRFALSLELDEDVLAYPPIKPDQQAVPTFWGIYRWPHSTYHRYTDLEGLEQTADETEAMKEALKCLSKVSNLGLCCDAGLGFLAGPDHIARNTTRRHPVFGRSNRNRTVAQEAERERSPMSTMAEIKHLQESVPQPAFDHPLTFKRTVLEKMVQDAGYAGEEANEAIRLILQTEETTLAGIDFDERRLVVNDYTSRQHLQTITFADFEPFSENGAGFPLIPASLTRAQKEMLLELEWAHRAMIQSYVIGLIDNALEGSFSNLTTLTIAKLPSSHVYIFNRHDLWQNLPSITHVTLGVIADWRQITKPTPGCIEDIPVSPVEAIGKAFVLLNDYIGAQPNIESLHFEWICGGEFAPGTFQRNHYILPAPFFQNAALMASPDSPRTQGDQFLRLPHVKHLSLKNCWFSPHVFLQSIRNLSLDSLEKLELETVSLSGPPTTTPQQPLQQHQVILQPPGTAAAHGYHPTALVPADPATAAQTLQNLAQQLPAGHAPLQLLTQGAGSHPNQELLQQPKWLSWAGIIEHFSPSVKIRDILNHYPDVETSNASGSTSQDQMDVGIHPLSKFVPRTHQLADDEERYKLKSLVFKSCGYVSVDCGFIDTRSILPGGAQGMSGNGNPHRHDFSILMQRCRDKMLGRISPYLCSEELFQLVNAFGMDIGWATVYDQQTTVDAMADGVDGPGRGRFSGTIDFSGIAEPRDFVTVEPLLPPEQQDITTVAALHVLEEDANNAANGINNNNNHTHEQTIALFATFLDPLDQ
ncbi:hypothetical protein BGZ63DRAFT_362734 [Mariannaea sp. PMI_226]|nr:hypothetical protein BGZ63DRAFT_362734 [Mariannaea sp. PMI_226]